MTTLRAFFNTAAADIAQGVLRNHGIPCYLADIDSHLNMPAIPVRLLVSQENVEEAGRILDSTDLALPPDFDPTKIEE